MVLSVDETRAVLAPVRGVARLMLEMVYGGGLRVSEREDEPRCCLSKATRSA